MTNKIQKLYRPLNEEEFADQIDKMGEAHYKESLDEHKAKVQAELESMKQKYEKEHQNDAFMKDALLGASLERHFPSENHEQRWARQNKIAQDLDRVNDKLRHYAQGSEEYEQLMAKRLALESLL